MDTKTKKLQNKLGLIALKKVAKKIPGFKVTKTVNGKRRQKTLNELTSELKTHFGLNKTQKKPVRRIKMHPY